jgi:hypothetical protein
MIKKEIAKENFENERFLESSQRKKETKIRRLVRKHLNRIVIRMFFRLC